ncbi:ABC transporter ATP-binding protein [Legionella steigerwaltii]|uniref:ABC transporter ATP-binding protein n=1 Tax=Legionella steigerwaltii TaxID=460 RepID=A0A378LG78_9GAMM|nr:ABC transporter ATP-binding protein [Legionella steigerwaltii]KTD77781.1 ABC transporter ATP-binding protein [Legionella steigerwaltii]STY23091.1 ABC transporter ATP-binding protein [Legionella steigerwaltii]
MIVQAFNLTKWFGTDNNKTYAVRNVSFELDFGEMLYIIGPSGSGKTTLLSIISGILRPNEGYVLVKGKHIWQLEDDALADFRLYSLGFVFQDFHLFPKLTSQENVAIPLILQKIPWNAALEKAKKALEIVGLSHRILVPPYKLSIGEQQRVAIARAIITEPELLIFDEPTASLDGETGKHIITFIKENILNDKRAIIIVTHDNRIFDFATRIITMEDGRISEGSQ